MFLLSWASNAQRLSPIDSERVKAFAGIREVTLGEILPSPAIKFSQKKVSVSEIDPSTHSDPDYSVILKIHKVYEDGDAKKAYIAASNYLEKRSSSPFAEWLYFFKADLLFEIQESSESPQYSLVVEDFELATRVYPLSEFVPRALFNLALINLRSGLYQEVELIVTRALKEFKGTVLTADLLLLLGEQAFRARKMNESLGYFSQVVGQFPQSDAAVDAAFRRAFILFRMGEFEKALATYKNLDKFHSKVFRILQMKEDARSEDRLLDRLYFAETLFLTARYADASELFQSLGNLFPSSAYTPFVWVRYGDTFFARGQPRSAWAIYDFVKTEYVKDKEIQSLVRIRIADTLFLTKDILSASKGEEYYREAFDLAQEAEDDVLSELALAKLGANYLTLKIYPKAQEVLRELKKNFKDSKNNAWVNDKYVDVLELEIVDHYRAHDYLAALTTYLVHEKDVSVQFSNVEVLLRIAEAAESLSLYGKSRDILNRVIYLESSSEARQKALLKLIGLLIQQGEIKKASERLRRFNFAYPATKLGYLYERAWGDLYASLDNSKKAVEHYEKSISDTKANPAALIEIRETLFKLGNLHAKLVLPLKAVQFYEEFLELYQDAEKVKMGLIPMTPRDVYLLKVARYRIADLYFSMKDYVQALDAYQRVSKSVKEEPFLSHSRYRIGECLLNLGDREAALEAFAQVKSEDPNNLWLRAAQGYISSVKMEVENGIEIFN